MSKIDAHAFLIWRFAAPKDWDVSYDEIADATGLTRNQVCKTIHMKRWGGRIGPGVTTEAMTLAHHHRGARVDLNNLDLTQLMASSVLPVGRGVEE